MKIISNHENKIFFFQVNSLHLADSAIIWKIRILAETTHRTFIWQKQSIRTVFCFDCEINHRFWISIYSVILVLGFRKIRTAASGNELLNPRSIGNLLAMPMFENHYDEERTVDTNNVMGLMFGQFLVHDVSTKIMYRALK